MPSDLQDVHLGQEFPKAIQETVSQVPSCRKSLRLLDTIPSLLDHATGPWLPPKLSHKSSCPQVHPRQFDLSLWKTEVGFQPPGRPPGHRATGSKLERVPMNGELSEVNLDHFAVPSLLKTFGNPNRQQCPSQIVRQDPTSPVLFSSPSPSISQGIKSEELDNIRTLFNQGPKYCLHSTPYLRPTRFIQFQSTELI